MSGTSVVLGLDRSPGAEKALALAVRLAGSLDVPLVLVLVHGVAPPGGVGEEAGEAREAIEEADDVVTGPAAAAEAAGVRTVGQAAAAVGPPGALRAGRRFLARS